MWSQLAARITDGQMLIAGLLSGGGVVGVIVKWVMSSPERESAAYKQGVTDESHRCAEDIKELRAHALEQAREITKLRNGLLRLAVASDLSAAQRKEIADALGYSIIPPPPTD